MKKLILLAVGAALLAACSGMDRKPPKTIETCELDGLKEKKLKIRYGDGQIYADYFTQASKKEFRKIVFDLEGLASQKPPKGSGVDYDKLVITIRSKTDTDVDVINFEISADDPVEYRTLCITNKDAKTYEYFIYVPGVGTIDPIIDIIPN